MSQTIPGHSDSFTSISESYLFRDGPRFTTPLVDIETTTTSLDDPHVTLTPFLGPAGATPGYQYSLVQSVEVCYARLVFQSQPLITL